MADLRCLFFGHVWKTKRSDHTPAGGDGWGGIWNGWTTFYQWCQRCGRRRVERIDDQDQDDYSRWMRGDALNPLASGDREQREAPEEAR